MTGKHSVQTGMNCPSDGDPHAAKVVQKRDFIDSVLAETGARRAEARPIIEATLAQLGRVLSSGQTLAVPPLGRARISTERDARGGEVITLRLRRRSD
ncbi:MAG: DNA-binding protein [Paracoccus sp. (in: a-proteobacteria)]